MSPLCSSCQLRGPIQFRAGPTFRSHLIKVCISDAEKEGDLTGDTLDWFGEEKILRIKKKALGARRFVFGTCGKIRGNWLKISGVETPKPCYMFGFQINKFKNGKLLNMQPKTLKFISRHTINSKFTVFLRLNFQGLLIIHKDLAARGNKVLFSVQCRKTNETDAAYFSLIKN